jgi:hypothetical protein
MELSKKNHGIVLEKKDGTTFKTAYGKDDSDVCGTAMKERMPHSISGGVDDLSHSIKGASANQKGS